MAVPATTTEGIRDLEHACEVATFLIGGSWAQQNLSDGQREAVRMLLEHARPQVVRVRFNPCNQLLAEIREYGASVHSGTPDWAQFPRWFDNGGSLWLESSSGGRLLTVRFDTEEIVVPSWKDGGRTEPMPSHWADLYLGSLFSRTDGSALYREQFEAAMAQDGWRQDRIHPRSPDGFDDGEIRDPVHGFHPGPGEGRES